MDHADRSADSPVESWVGDAPSAFADPQMAYGWGAYDDIPSALAGLDLTGEPVRPSEESPPAGA